MNNSQSDDDVTSASSTDEEDDNFLVECSNRFGVCFKKCRQNYTDIKWHEIFHAFDLIDDLLLLDVGCFYVVILEKSHSRKCPSFHFITFMEILLLNAEHFCERIISKGNLVMKDRNTFLDDDELEILMLIGMNRDFMKFIQRKYTQISKQNFKQTTIREEYNNEEQSSMVALVKV